MTSHQRRMSPTKWLEWMRSTLESSSEFLRDTPPPDLMRCGATFAQLRLAVEQVANSVERYSLLAERCSEEEEPVREWKSKFYEREGWVDPLEYYGVL